MMTYEDIIECLFELVDILDYGGLLDEEDQKVVDKCHFNYDLLCQVNKEK